MYSTWRVTKLKEELKKRGASQRGNKAELVERLEAYDRNFNFESIHNSPESQMELPEDGMFRDVNSATSLPPLTKNHINFFFQRFNKKTDDGYRLYESRYLLVLRSCKLGDNTFVKGICKASMKKLQYEVNAKIINDGSIEETTCECVVGSGKEAHCKHVAVVLYATWRVNKLKEELKKRGASQRGNKAELVERLEAYDRNFNFESIHNSPESQMELPEDGMFRDVNSATSLPPLTKNHINFFFQRFNKKTDDGYRLYESRYLLVLRSCKLGDNTFVKGICKASMKKLQYEVNAKIINDGSIEETTCECVVGSGKEAHCKHVAVVLYAVEQMCREGHMLLHVACTQELQQFHRPKKVFTASPMKAERLPSQRRLSNIFFHPYPMENINKENYNTRVRNICIGAASSTMPLKQRFGPANPYAIINDHQYHKEDAREILCQRLGLIKTSSEEINIIENKTRGQAKNPLWFEERRNRITASNFHTVCHLTPQSQKSFAEQLLIPRSFKSRATTHGIINESVAIKMYKDRYNFDVKDCGLFVSKTYPYLGASRASPDGLLGDETIIEVKCPYASRNQMITKSTVPYLYEENGEVYLKKTCTYYYQIQGQLYCANKKYCNLIIYTYKDFKVIYISRDEDFINSMVGKLVAFYKNYFKSAVLNKYMYRNYK